MQMELGAKSSPSAAQPSPSLAAALPDNNNSSGDAFMQKDQQKEETPICTTIRKTVKNVLLK